MRARSKRRPSRPYSLRRLLQAGGRIARLAIVRERDHGAAPLDAGTPPGVELALGQRAQMSDDRAGPRRSRRRPRALRPARVRPERLRVPRPLRVGCAAETRRRGSQRRLPCQQPRRCHARAAPPARPTGSRSPQPGRSRSSTTASPRRRGRAPRPVARDSARTSGPPATSGQSPRPTRPAGAVAVSVARAQLELAQMQTHQRVRDRLTALVGERAQALQRRPRQGQAPRHSPSLSGGPLGRFRDVQRCFRARAEALAEVVDRLPAQASCPAERVEREPLDVGTGGIRERRGRPRLGPREFAQRSPGLYSPTSWPAHTRASRRRHRTRRALGPDSARIAPCSEPSRLRRAAPRPVRAAVPAGSATSSGVSKSVTRCGSPAVSRYVASANTRSARSGAPAGVRRTACSPSRTAWRRAPRAAASGGRRADDLGQRGVDALRRERQMQRLHLGALDMARQREVKRAPLTRARVLGSRLPRGAGATDVRGRHRRTSSRSWDGVIDGRGARDRRKLRDPQIRVECHGEQHPAQRR